jgi:hypothetical protein
LEAFVSLPQESKIEPFSLPEQIAPRETVVWQHVVLNEVLLMVLSSTSIAVGFRETANARILSKKRPFTSRAAYADRRKGAVSISRGQPWSRALQGDNRRFHFATPNARHASQVPIRDFTT